MSAAAWVAAGVLAGAAAAALAAWPAAWVAARVGTASAERVLLADARGSVWRGSAVLVLTGGDGSRDASQLPGRLHWRLGLDGSRPTLWARQDCCIDGELRLQLRPGLGRWAVEVQPDGAATTAASGAAASPAAAPAPLPGAPPVMPPSAGEPALRRVGQWPAAWLAGLGTPWNTLQPRGTLRLATAGLVVEAVGGRWVLTGRAELDLDATASRVSTLPWLGDYRVGLRGDPRGDGADVTLATRDGPLQLSGNGRWSAGRLRFRGQAAAAPGAEAALNNLLNLLGRRQGALSLISIG